MDRRILQPCWSLDPHLETELPGIKQALKLAKDRQWELVDVESDSLVAMKNINSDEPVENHPKRALIEDCRKLK